MSGFTKLVPEIVQSSIWNEPSDMRIVWITMLAVKDSEGYVRGNAQTIARIANVSIEATEKALELFQAPDENSHTQDDDGRRIEKYGGGWMVLNHSKYRAKEAKDVHAEYVAKWRAKKKKEGVIKCDSQVNHASASASASASVKEGSQEGGGSIHDPIDPKEAKTIPGAVALIKKHPAFEKAPVVALENLFKEYDFCREHWPKIIRQFMTNYATVESPSELKHPPIQKLRWAIDDYCEKNKIGKYQG